jgi:hypothetical protein
LNIIILLQITQRHFALFTDDIFLRFSAGWFSTCPILREKEKKRVFLSLIFLFPFSHHEPTDTNVFCSFKRTKNFSRSVAYIYIIIINIGY